VAYDEAFNCYFPDTIDLLELMGATLVDFSPLHDEQLPPGADLVFVGCGHPERYATELTENYCMTSALRNHLCGGKRIYADGGGLAYLCQSIETPDGRSWPMVGALPAIARLNPNPAPCQPVELSLARPSWLGEVGTRVRGYRNSRWMLEPAGPLRALFAEPGHACDMVGCFRAVASCLQINLATQPGFLRTFFEPLAPAEALGSAAIASH
jgi:cobyrinic acid a,c-diamide synthase